MGVAGLADTQPNWILAMNDAELLELARSYLLWRKHGMSVWSYLRQSADRIVPATLFYAVLVALFIWAGYYIAVVGILCFWIGQVIRDVQWARAFVRGWPKVCEFIDWAKVERLAGADSATM
jgi:hypothetical protein